MSDPIKPCPFCGQEAKQHERKSKGFDTTYSVSCSNYGCFADLETILCDSMEQAIKMWNTRATDTELDTLRAELAAVTAERDELRQSNRVISHQLERRADGMDDATQLLRKEKWDAIEQLKQTQAELAAARRELEQALGVQNDLNDHIMFEQGNTKKVSDAMFKVIDEKNKLRAQLAAARQELELTQKKLSRITNETSHPFGGSMSWRECIKCDNPYPEWTAMSSMTCPACKLAAAQSALEAEKQAHGETRENFNNFQHHNRDEFARAEMWKRRCRYWRDQEMQSRFVADEFIEGWAKRSIKKWRDMYPHFFVPDDERDEGEWDEDSYKSHRIVIVPAPDAGQESE